MIEALERDVRDTGTYFMVRREDGRLIELKKTPYSLFSETVILFVWPTGGGLPRAHVAYRSRMAIGVEY